MTVGIREDYRSFNSFQIYVRINKEDKINFKLIIVLFYPCEFNLKKIRVV